MKTKRMEEMIQLGLDNGLDPFPIVFETVERSTMANVASYGLPTRARHWSYGRSYEHQKTYGEMGFSKIYEMILNNNPSYAFMLDTNSEVQNIFITAHCLGHSHVFKNNYMFKRTDRNMIGHAAEHAKRIESYIERFGFERVEHLMDIGFALDNHVDWHKGLYRKPYGKKQATIRYREPDEFEDIINKKPTVIKEVKNSKFPPHPEKDILWFLINYAPLEEWERDVLDIIREETYYFYPQRLTKILHEGAASYWHAELMYQFDLSSEEHLDFVRTHERVVQPGANPFNINPYYLGFVIFKDIEKRWDEKYGKGAGKKKIFDVIENENDISFLRNYLTADLVKELKLFTFGYAKNYPKKFNGEKLIEIKECMRNDVVESLVKPLYHGGAPKIVVKEIGQEGTLILKHDSEEIGTIDQNFAKRTIEYVWDLWAAPVELQARDDDGSDISICFDEAGAYINNYDDDASEEELELAETIIIMP
jgi:stage V sporulation protein R